MLRKYRKTIGDIIYGRPRAMNSLLFWRMYRVINYLGISSLMSRTNDYEKLNSEAWRNIVVNPTRLTSLHVSQDEEYLKLKNTIIADGFRVDQNLQNSILVEITDQGSMIVVNGKKRVQIACELETPEIPVYVIKRAPGWKKFRLEVFRLSKSAAKGAYQPLIHPDFQKFLIHRKEDRWPLIKNTLQLKSGTVIDIGSNLGYFCHKFEEAGFSCTAVERNYMYLYFLRRLRDIENRHFSIYASSIFDLEEIKFDIVLALSIFHHFLRTRELFEDLTIFLNKLDIKYMYFEPHETGKGFTGSFMDFNEEEFVEYILKNSCLNQSKLLGSGERGRNLYLLSK